MRKKKHNLKIAIITGIILFVVISVVVINAQDMKTISRVKVSNQSIVITQGETGLNNTDVGFNNTGGLNNQDINGNNLGLNIDNNGNINNTGGSFNNVGNFGNQDTSFGNQGDFNNTGGHFGNTNPEFGNNHGFNNENLNNDFGTYNVGFGNKDYQSETNRYKYQNIDWGTWKSNFVNRILDDSLYIKSLDNYGVGTWFYYSFNVTDKGEIKDVTVFSLYLSDDDKKQIRNMIRRYAHKPITIFPKDSKRKQAKVKAIMLLGDSESKSNASNFRDVEKIKIQY